MPLLGQLEGPYHVQSAPHDQLKVLLKCITVKLCPALFPCFLTTVFSKNTPQQSSCLEISETQSLGSDCTHGTLGFIEKAWFISSFIHSSNIFQVATMSDIVLIATIINRTGVIPDYTEIEFWWDL